MSQHASVRAFVQGMLKERNDEAAVGDDASLFLSGRLDSLAAVNLVMFLEQEFGVDFVEIGLDLERVDSVSAIVELIHDYGDAAHRQAQGAS